MIERILEQPWMYWGLFVLLGMPILVIVFSETIHKLTKRNSEFLDVAYNLRNFLVPSLFFYILLRNVLELSDQSLLLKVVATAFWIILIHSVLKFINTVVFSEVLPIHVRDRIPKLLVDFLRTFLVLVGVAFVLSEIWDANLARLLTALGVGSVVIGLALQDVLGGLFSGLALLSSRPFAVGDWIKVGELEGQVKSIDWRAVTIVTRQKDDVVIPNSVLGKTEFHNFNRPDPVHMERVGFDISFDDPPSKVKRVLEEAALATPGILKDPAPIATLISYDEFSVHYEILIFMEDYAKKPLILNDFTSRIWYANRRYGVTFPTRAHEVYTYEGPDQTEAQFTPEAIADILKRMSVLDIKREHLLELGKHSHIEDYGNGECILWKGEMANNFYIISKGKVVEQDLNDDGIMSPLHTLSRGDFFGISGMVRREPNSVNVVAQGDVEVISIEGPTMRKILQWNPHVAQTLESIVASRKRMLKKREARSVA